MEIKKPLKLRVESHFKNEVNSRFGPPPISMDLLIFFRFFFSLFPKEIHFPIEKKEEKKEAPQAPKNKMTLRRRRHRGKKIYFFFDYFFWKNNLAKFWKFWEFLSFFTMVSIGKVSISAKCLFGRIGGLKNL